VNVAFGFNAHSGWAALVIVGKRGREYVLSGRRRVELVDEPWAKQPYHAAEGLTPAEARTTVERGVEAGRRIALREMRAAVALERSRGNTVGTCAVLVGNPMPAWTTGEILAVHFRMHKAEGVLFRDVLIRASRACRIKTVEMPLASLPTNARLTKQVAALGKTAGPPWGKDQKEAALAALAALEGTAS
jgi:hypothetical protein